MNPEDVRETAPSVLNLPPDTTTPLSPFKSMEKLALSQVTDLIESPLPLRRSPRLSSPHPISFPINLDSNLNADFSGEESPSRPETPDNDGLVQDEPSSVLASRIMRAHDNPSPPPQSPENTFLHPKLMHDTSNTSLSPTPDPREDPFSADEPQHSISARVPITPLHHQHPAAQTNFDTARQFILPITEHNSLHTDLQDDLHIPEPSETAIGSPPSDDSEERIVAESLLTSEPTSADSVTPVIESSAEDSSNPEESSALQLRRSSRPRRSVHNLSPLRDVAVVKDSSPSLRLDELQALSAPNSDHTVAPLSPTRRKPRKSGHQKLTSLSPHSLKLLGEISGETSEDSGVGVVTPSTTSAAQVDTITEPVVSNSRRPEVAPNTPSKPPAPIRFPSPKRTNRPPSPNKYQLHIPIAGPSTPARRIPISDAVARGQISPQKAAQLSVNRGAGSSRTPFIKIPPNDTPARRIPILPPQSNSPSKSVLDLSQRKRPLLHERSRSVEPESSVPIRVKPRSGSVESTSVTSKLPQHLMNSRTTQQLPFPIIHEDATEQQETQETSAPSKAPPAQRTTLKQLTSKIPRRTIKPYSRPTSSTTPKEAVNRGKQSPVKVVEQPKSPLKMQANISQAASSSNPNLKRKRATFEKPSFAKPEVVVTPLRHVPSLSKPSTSSRSQSSPKKSQALLNLRLVEMEKPPDPPADIPVHSSNTPAKSESIQSVMDNLPSSTSAAPHTATAPLSSDTISDTQPSFSVNGTEAVLVQHDAIPELSEVVATDLPELPVFAEEPLEPYGLRRTTRVRKPVMGLNPPSTRRVDISSQPRRRKPHAPHGTGPFSSMTAGDLRQLTNSNTTKNQKYLTAMLETEIIRREGPRPESPGIRAKTVSQKEQEEKESGKDARAERRANRTKRRSEDSLEDNGESSWTTGLQETDDDDGANEAWEHLNSSPSVRRYRRGAGEDEDYEASKQPKRFRLDENADEDEKEGMGEKKRVKWDQGLFTTVFLDEVQPRPRHGVVAAAKGCLAPTSKATKLDDLGNLPSTESPLKDLVQENVVVKKFVYDTDLPEPPPVVVKNTRSKKKLS